jgi:enoyl-CoA hydratase
MAIDYADYERLGVERRGDVLVVRIQHPGNGAEHTELSRLFCQVRADDVKVVVITGVANTFMPLADMTWYASVGEEDWLRLMREGKWLLRDLADLPQPVVVGLNGPAVGLGASIATLADVIIAADDASMSDAHVTMGLVAGDGGAMTFPLSMGLHRTKAFYLMNQTLSAKELHDAGVVAEVVPREQLEDRVLAVAEEIAAAPSEALQWTKMVLNRGLQMSLLLGAEASMGHEGWSWHLRTAQDKHSALQPRGAEGG